MSTIQIEKKYVSLIKRQQKLTEEFKTFRESIQAICPHTICTDYTVDRDNGYGRWWKEARRNCSMCGQTFYQYLDSEWKILDTKNCKDCD